MNSSAIKGRSCLGAKQLLKNHLFGLFSQTRLFSWGLISEEVRLLSQLLSKVATKRKLKEVAPLGLRHSSSEISSQESSCCILSSNTNPWFGQLSWSYRNKVIQFNNDWALLTDVAPTCSGTQARRQQPFLLSLWGLASSAKAAKASA